MSQSKLRLWGLERTETKPIVKTVKIVQSKSQDLQSLRQVIIKNVIKNASDITKIATDITTLTEQLEKLSNELMVLESEEVNDANESIKTLRDSIKNLNKEVKNLEAEKHREKIDRQRLDFNLFKANYENTVNDLETLRSDIDNCKSKFNDITSQIDHVKNLGQTENQEILDQMQAKLDSISEKIDNLNKIPSMEELRREFQLKENELGTDDQILTRLADLTSDVNKIKRDVSQNDVTNKLEELENDLSELETTITNLEESDLISGDIKERIAKLEALCQQLESKEDISQSIEQVKQKVEEISNNYTSLKSLFEGGVCNCDLGEIREKLKQFPSKIDMQTSLDELSERVNEIKTLMDNSEISKCDCDLSTLVVDLKTLENSLNNVKQKVADNLQQINSINEDELGDIRTNIQDLSNRIGILDEIETKLDGLESQQVTEKLQSMKQTIQGLKTRLTTLESDSETSRVLNETKQSVDNLKINLGDYKKSQIRKYNVLETDIQSCQDSCSEFAQKLARVTELSFNNNNMVLGIQTDIGTLQSDFETLKGQVPDDNQLNNLERAITNVKKSIAEHVLKIKSLTEDVSDLKTKIQNVDNLRTDMELKLEEMKSLGPTETTGTPGDTVLQEQQIQELRAEVQSLENDIHKFIQDTQDSLTGQIEEFVNRTLLSNPNFQSYTVEVSKCLETLKKQIVVIPLFSYTPLTNGHRMMLQTGHIGYKFHFDADIVGVTIYSNSKVRLNVEINNGTQTVIIARSDLNKTDEYFPVKYPVKKGNHAQVFSHNNFTPDNNQTSFYIELLLNIPLTTD